MASKSELKKRALLGVSSMGKARNDLQNLLLHSYSSELGLTCHHCKTPVDLKDISITNIYAWGQSKEITVGNKLFFNLDNWRISHVRCTGGQSSGITHKRDVILGMPYGTARNKIRDKIVFKLWLELNENSCFHCSDIMTYENFSIEHNESWMSAENPHDSYFRLDNISFSHRKCNYAASVSPYEGSFNPDVIHTDKSKYKYGFRGLSYRGERNAFCWSIHHNGKKLKSTKYWQDPADAAREFDKKWIELKDDTQYTNEGLGFFDQEN